VIRDSPRVTARDERPVFFDAHGQTLFGVFTRPTTPPRMTAVILLTGGDHIPSINRNRLWVRLARTLAGDGYHVLRFDYHGVGESTGLVEYFELEKPFTSDVEAAVRWIRGQGIDEFVLVGICFGAGTALSCVGRIEGLRGIVASAHPVHDLEMLQGLGTMGYVRQVLEAEGLAGLLRRAPRARSYVSYLGRRIRAGRSRRGRDGTATDPQPGRASELFLRQVARVADLRVPTLFVYGTDDGYLERFERARNGALGETLARAGSVVEIATLDGPAHQLTALDVQDAFLGLVESWLAELARR
jgi:pimeloyl-ACP methyl ester carboxylesterase